MPFPVTCPECSDRQTVPDEAAGKRLRCKSCGTVFRAAAPDVDVVVDEPPERDRAKRTQGDRPGRPTKKAGSARARDDEDDEDDLPVGKDKRAKKKTSVPFVIGSVAAFLLAAGAIIWVVTVWRDSNRNAKDPDKPVADRDSGGEAGGVADKNSRAAALKYGEPPGMVGTHVHLSPPAATPTAGGGVELVIDCEFLGDHRPAQDYVIVVVHRDGWTITPMDGPGMPTGQRDKLKLTLGPEARRGVEIWIGKLGMKPDAVDPGRRVSEIVRYN